MMRISLFSHARTSRFDLTALALAPLGVVVIILSQLVAGAPLGALLRPEAAVIVFGGTCAALLVSYAPRELGAAIRAAIATFRVGKDDTRSLAQTMLVLAGIAHRRGLVAVESELESVTDGFLREGVNYAIDNPSPESLRNLLTVESSALTVAEEAPARLFETAAGYAPTFGILGAVLGLIDVMRHLSAPSVLGNGVAAAFAATVYGLGIANLIFLPIAGRLRQHAAHAARRRELIAHGICSIHQRTPPRALAYTLRAYGVEISEDAPTLVARTTELGRISA